jgi:hypothetical protein
MSSNPLCKACTLLESLEHGMRAATIDDAVSETTSTMRTIAYFQRPNKVQQEHVSITIAPDP